MGRSSNANLFLDDWLVLGLNVPALVIIILCYVWFGLNELAAILAVSLNKIPMVAVIMREGARSIEKIFSKLLNFTRFKSRLLFKIFSSFTLPIHSFISSIWFVVDMENSISCRIARKK